MPLRDMDREQMWMLPPTLDELLPLEWSAKRDGWSLGIGPWERGPIERMVVVGSAFVPWRMVSVVETSRPQHLWRFTKDTGMP